MAARRLGPFSTRDGVRGFQVQAFVESSTVDIDTGFDGTLLPEIQAVTFDGDAKWTTMGAEATYGTGWGSMGVSFGVATIEDDDVATAEADSCPAFAADISVPWLELGRWDVVTHARVGIVSGDVSADTAVRSDLTLVQADLDVGVAYAIRRETAFALSPYGGLGYRRIDGMQDYGDSRSTEFDASAIYGFGGAELEWLPRESLRLSVGGHALFGQVQGFALTMAVGF